MTTNNIRPRCNSLNPSAETQFGVVTQSTTAKFRLVPNRILLAKVVKKENASLNEIRALRTLTRTEGRACKHIITMLCYSEVERSLTLEFLTLGDLSQQNTNYDPNETKMILYQILEALIYIQSFQIYHGDLKLENVGCTTPSPYGRVPLVKLLDFEFSGDEAVWTDVLCGSIEYLAPEICPAISTRYSYSHKSDVWAFGVIMYLLLNDFYPFSKPEIRLGIHCCRRLANDNCVLFRHVFDKCPKTRFTASSLSGHAWFDPVRHIMNSTPPKQSRRSNTVF